jgi:hypothetical protein
MKTKQETLEKKPIRFKKVVKWHCAEYDYLRATLFSLVLAMIILGMVIIAFASKWWLVTVFGFLVIGIPAMLCLCLLNREVYYEKIKDDFQKRQQ